MDPEPSPSWLARAVALDGAGDSFLARSPAGTNQNGTLFGGLVAAQSLAAAGATVDDPAKHPHSLHAYFVRGGRPDVDLELTVERTRDGRGFATRRVTAVQDGRAIFELLASFHVDEPGPDDHPPAPPMPPPAACTALREIGNTDRFEMRSPAPGGGFTGPPHWVRVLDPIEDDPMLRACALTYVSDMGLMAAARPPGIELRWRTGVLAASLDHSVWLHRPFDPNRWHQYHAAPLNTVGARGLALGSLYDEDGALVATMAQEALWRVR